MNSKLLELLRFGIVGIIATIVLYLTYWLFLRWLNPTLSYSIGYFLAFIANYLLTTSFTFKVKKTVKNGVGFVLSNITNYLVSIGLLNIFLHIGVNDRIAPIATIMLGTLSNYIIVRTVMKIM